MNKFKTLVRKSDGQWMNFMGSISGIVECTLPQPTRPIEELKEIKVNGQQIEWSLYDLIEVAVVRMDDVPGDDKIDLQVLRGYIYEFMVYYENIMGDGNFMGEKYIDNYLATLTE